jgi:hypothetical protein
MAAVKIAFIDFNDAINLKGISLEASVMEVSTVKMSDFEWYYSDECSAYSIINIKVPVEALINKGNETQPSLETVLNKVHDFFSVRG